MSWYDSPSAGLEVPCLPQFGISEVRSMPFSHLIDHLREDPGVASALTALERQSILIPDLGVPARAALSAAAIDRHSGPALVVASRADRAEELAASLAEYLPQRRVLLWPAPEALPYEQLPFDLQSATHRAALLTEIASPHDAQS